MNKVNLLLLVLGLTGCQTPATPTAIMAPTTQSAAAPVPAVAPAPTPTATPSPTAPPSPSPSPSPSPTAVSTTTNADHACSIMSDATVQCTGDTAHGQAPAQVVDLTGASELALGTSFSCALTDAGAVWCWGQGKYLGMGSSQGDSATALEVINSGVVDVQAYGGFVCALVHVGGGDSPYCWGSPDGTNYVYAPALENVPYSVAQIAVGTNMACAAAAPYVYCWGSGYSSTEQTLWTSQDLQAVTPGATGQVCVAGTSSGSHKSQCYSNLGAGGQL